MIFDNDDFTGGFDARSDAMKDVCDVLVEDIKNIPFGSQIQIVESEYDDKRNIIALDVCFPKQHLFDTWYDSFYFKEGTDK